MKENLFEQKQASQNHQVMVYEEMEPLKDLIIWGEPGCEAVLGQLLPDDVSLFWKTFKVVEARKEYRGMEEMFKNEGINAIRMKDIVALNPAEFPIKDLPKNMIELETKLIGRATLFHDTYHLNNLNEAKNDIRTILKEDLDYYKDEKSVILLNTILSLSNKLPLANIFYARDQSDALGNQIIMSRMRREIRQPEVTVFKRAYEVLGYSNNLVNLPDGYFEGGDGYIFGNKCLIGSGYRTDSRGIEGIFKGIGKDLETSGIELYNVANTRELKKGEEMDAMHLDTFMMPLNKDTVLGCGKEIANRKVQRVLMCQGEVQFKDVGNLADFLDHNGIRVINIEKAEQLLYATNFLHLGHNKVIVPLEDKEHERVNSLMANEVGLDVKIAGIKELVGGYGAVHCMTAAIKRG